MMTAGTVEIVAATVRDGLPVAEVLARPGTRTVLLAGSRDPNAKLTLILLDGYGAAFVVKVPTTGESARVVQEEGELLEAVRRMPIGRLATTVPQPLGYLDAEDLPALVTNALAGTPMNVRYHAWRHTARRRRVRADFAAAGAWLAELQTRTAGRRAPVVLLDDALDRIGSRFADHPDLPALRSRLAGPADRLSHCATPRTVVHGDYWYGNLLVARERRATRVVGVVDWEAGARSGEPLRDVARFAVSYALYLDRHVRPGHRVPGHRGLRADSWGAGLMHAARGTGWFGAVIREYLVAAAERLGLPGRIWPDIMLAGIADVAATADHPDFARDHVELLVRLTGGVAA
jgi:aminoglycoside phosphotransferase (APT) family kinase protein